MRKKKNTDDEILNELYKRSFAASTPPADFEKLVENAEINEFGKKLIPFMDYECPIEVMEKIFNDVMSEYKVPKNKIKGFSFNFWLGCSPKTSKVNHE